MKSILKFAIPSIIMAMMVGACSEASGRGTLTMVLSGSVHGQLDPCGWKKNPLGGLSRRFVKINELRESGIDPLILDAGDLFFSTKNINQTNKKSEIYRAGAIIEGYEKIGCDAINVGHYETLNGLTFLKDVDSKTDIPFLSANLRDSKSNDLIFDPFLIVEKDGLRVGIIGVTDKLPDTSKSMTADNYIEAGQKYINEIERKTDLIVMMVNSDRGTHDDLPDHFKKADFIFTSGSTNLTRNSSKSQDDDPFLFSCGKQGKYLCVLNIKLEDDRKPFVNILTHEKNIKSIQKRFERLQKKDPDKTLNDIYTGQENVLKLIEQNRAKLKTSEDLLANAINTIKFETIALNRKIQDNPEILAFVDESLARCISLKPKSSKPFPKNIGKKEGPLKSKLTNSHEGHDH